MSIHTLQIPEEVYEHASRKDLVVLLKSMSELQTMMHLELEQLKMMRADLEERLFVVAGQLVKVTAKVFGKSSEKLAPDPGKKKRRKPPKKRGKVTRLPSQRYPNAPVIEKEVKLAEAPSCRCCNLKMVASGLTEIVEYLHTVPKQFFVIREKREKYRCKTCHGDIQTAPALPRMTPGSAYSDEMTIDAALSKYCDLIPMERYSAMAGRQGLEGLPPNSLIEASHSLAEFVAGAVSLVRDEILELEVLRADETPHKMLEGDPRTNWYLWGFSGDSACYFEYHDTRSGDVASAILKSAKCSILLTDVYSGYGKAIRMANIERSKNGLRKIAEAYCNAHSRRKFNDAKQFDKERQYYLDKYREIYILEAEARGKSPPGVLAIRKKMEPLFEELRRQAEADRQRVSSKSSLAVACNYFLGNYDGLTLFLSNPELPIDNNAQERSLRSHVVGRKTWYGTHSRRGAETAAKLFTLVETCKLCNINPRQYFSELIKSLHAGEAPFTPSQYKARSSN